MPFASNQDAYSVLILKSDRVYGEALRQLTQTAIPNAKVSLTASLDAAQRVMAAESINLVVTGLGRAIAGDVLEFIAGWMRRRPLTTRVLVVSTHLEKRFVAALRSLSIHGVFDAANDQPEHLAAAMRHVAAGRPYWSPNILDHLHRNIWAPGSILRLLTLGEQLVLSVVGDGSDDESAAQELGMNPATVGTIRRQLHRKLGVQHRGELVRIAAEFGFVRFTPSGVVRPGFAALAEAYRARARRPKETACLG